MQLTGKKQSKMIKLSSLESRFQGCIYSDANFVSKFFKSQQYFWGQIKESHRTHKQPEGLGAPLRCYLFTQQTLETCCHTSFETYFCIVFSCYLELHQIICFSFLCSFCSEVGSDTEVMFESAERRHCACLCVLAIQVLLPALDEISPLQQRVMLQQSGTELLTFEGFLLVLLFLLSFN